MRTHDVRVTVTEVDGVIATGLADPFAGGLADPFRETMRRPGAPRTIIPVELQVTNDMLELADDFMFTAPFSLELWQLCRKDAEVQVWIDESCVLTGYITGRRKKTGRDGSMIEVRGLDKGGRIVAESAPLVRFDGYDLKGFIEDMVSPWFDTVSLSNARNRKLIRGSGGRAPVAGEPAIRWERNAQKKIEPGESRGEAILHMLERAELLAWSSADGEEFIIGRPNYDQAPQWTFFVAGPDSDRNSNVLESEYDEDNDERYAAITVCGAARGKERKAAGYSSTITNRRSTVFAEESADGTGGDFIRPKALLLSNHDCRTVEDALREARREQKLRDGRGRALELEAAGFGQEYAGASVGNPFGQPAIFACDTIADYEDEELEMHESWLVTRVVFSQSKDAGQTARLTFVPEGTELRAR